MAGETDVKFLKDVLSRAVDDQLFLGHKRSSLAARVDANKCSLQATRAADQRYSAAAGARPARTGFWSTYSHVARRGWSSRGPQAARRSPKRWPLRRWRRLNASA